MQHKIDIRIALVTLSNTLRNKMRQKSSWLAATRTVPESYCPSLPTSLSVLFIYPVNCSSRSASCCPASVNTLLHAWCGRVVAHLSGVQLFHTVADGRLAQANDLPARLKLRAWATVTKREADVGIIHLFNS